MFHFMIMGTLSYYLENYVEGYIGWDVWKDHLVILLRAEGLHFHDQYIITVGVYYVIRYFQGLQKQEMEKSELTLKTGRCKFHWLNYRSIHIFWSIPLN